MKQNLDSKLFWRAPM